MLAEKLRQCSHSWLMTIDNSPEIRELYSWANVISFYWKKPYSMTSINGNKSGRDSKNLELLISSFEIDPDELMNKQSNILSPNSKVTNSKDLNSLMSKTKALVSP